MFTSAPLNDSSVYTTTSQAISQDQLSKVMIALSCLAVFVVIVLLGSLIYRKDPSCCKSQAYRDSHADLEASSQHYSSRQTLVSSPCTDLPQHFDSLDNFNPEPGQLFYVGLTSTYCLPPMDQSLPHLPSYESVRKKDRQRQIHMMIADRFGLNGPATAATENPPTYEESVRQSLQSLQNSDPNPIPIPIPMPIPIHIPNPNLNLNTNHNAIPPTMRPQVVLAQPVNALPQYEGLTHSTTSAESNNVPHSGDSV
ncbi:uncharacterized protein si:ch73-364h19.1 [Tachysurus fulvidraco]|uniref:uncharacterized protein si:ch73-364h19.1 n=1 Tax=Tachysurus fulvidraco TaxID=1234273 RepID=UPI000F4F83FA|nr:uncharacterized protein si:ch73-364h19.1 [Tachysurus fulvidraco]